MQRSTSPERVAVYAYGVRRDPTVPCDLDDYAMGQLRLAHDMSNALVEMEPPRGPRRVSPRSPRRQHR